MSPGVITTIGDVPGPRSAPTDTGVAFVADFAERGAAGPIEITSLSQHVPKLGNRVSYSLGYDWLDTFFHEGGGKAYFSRIFGPAPVTASVTLNDTVPASSLIVKANSPGAWANGASGGLKVEVIGTGGTRTLNFYFGATPTLVESVVISSQADAVAWSTTSQYVTITAGVGTGLPVAIAQTNLTGGNDDHANATDTQIQAALDKFTKDYGPGQVVAPGRTTTSVHTMLLAHAEANNRTALLDLVDTATVATLTGEPVALRAAGAKVRFGGAFTPWAVIPGLALGTTRIVPYSAVEAGLMARSDGAGNSANVAAAGENGQARYAIDLTQVFSLESDRNTLNDAGVNLARVLFRGIRTYGYRTLVAALTDPNWIQLSSSRMIMQIKAEAEAVLERHVFAQIDGRGIETNKVGGELRAMLAPFWASGGLYGATAEEAFNVDVGSQINTAETIAAGELHAEIAVKTSPFAELVILNIVKVGVTEAVA